MSFNNSHYLENQYTSSQLKTQLNSQRDLKQDGQSQQFYMNDEPSETLIFDEEIPYKATINLAENEAHSSIISSNSFEFDQYIDDNHQNFYELEQLNKTSSDLIQASTLNNNNKYLQNSEYVQYDPNFNDLNQQGSTDFFADNSQQIPPSYQQLYYQDNYQDYEQYRKQFMQQNKDQFYPQFHSFEKKEIISHNYNNQQNQMQTYFNPQINKINNNNSEISKNHQIGQTEGLDYCTQQRCGFIELNGKQKNYQQIPQNKIDLQKMKKFQNISLNTTQEENRYQQFIKEENQKGIINNMRGNESPHMNQNYFNDAYNINYLTQNQLKLNKQTEQIEQEFQNLYNKEIPSNFNYYEYYKIYGDKQNSDLSLDNNEIVQPNENQNNFCQSPYLFETQINLDHSLRLEDSDQNQIAQRNFEFNGEIQINKQNLTLAQNDISNTNNQQLKQTNSNMETNETSKHEIKEKLEEEQPDQDENQIFKINHKNNKNKKSYICTKNSESNINTLDEKVAPKKDEDEIIQKIEEMKTCNKKNVVKNIMNAFRNFILEAELKNTLKVNSNIIALYNNSKTEDSDNLQQIIKKFKRYINSKNFNHYTIRLLILHPNYGPVFQYYLQGPFYDWANACKASDLPSHFVMVDFLLLSFKDIKYIEELKRHDKKKAHYQ